MTKRGSLFFKLSLLSPFGPTGSEVGHRDAPPLLMSVRQHPRSGLEDSSLPDAGCPEEAGVSLGKLKVVPVSTNPSRRVRRHSAGGMDPQRGWGVGWEDGEGGGGLEGVALPAGEVLTSFSSHLHSRCCLGSALLTLRPALIVFVVNGEKGKQCSPVAAEETRPTWISFSIMNDTSLCSPPEASLRGGFLCVWDGVTLYEFPGDTLFQEEFSPETTFKIIIKFLNEESEAKLARLSVQPGSCTS